MTGDSVRARGRIALLLWTDRANADLRLANLMMPAFEARRWAGQHA
jgi:hypothetical protein